MQKFVVLIVGAFLLVSCTILKSEDQSPSFKRQEYLGDEFRLDGYYYEKFNSDSNGVAVERLQITFYFRNGVSLYGGSPTLSQVPEREKEFTSGKYFAENKDNKLCWGIFKVEGGKIIEEGWVNPNGTFLVIREITEISNDSTLNRISSERIDGSEKTTAREKSIFRQFEPKPDSIASLID